MRELLWFLCVALSGLCCVAFMASTSHLFHVSGGAYSYHRCWRGFTFWMFTQHASAHAKKGTNNPSKRACLHREGGNVTNHGAHDVHGLLFTPGLSEMMSRLPLTFSSGLSLIIVREERTSQLINWINIWPLYPINWQWGGEGGFVLTALPAQSQLSCAERCTVNWLSAGDCS